MANVLANIGRGKVGHYAGLPAAADAITIVILEAAEVDDTLRDYDDLAALLAAPGNTEATATGYARRQTTDHTFAVDDTGNTASVTKTADETYTSVAGNAWQKLLMCYDGDTAAGTDANITPLTLHDFVVTPNGGDITADFAQVAPGWWQSS